MSRVRTYKVAEVFKTYDHSLPNNIMLNMLYYSFAYPIFSFWWSLYID